MKYSGFLGPKVRGFSFLRQPAPEWGNDVGGRRAVNLFMSKSFTNNVKDSKESSGSERGFRGFCNITVEIF